MTSAQIELLDQLARDAPHCAPTGTTSVASSKWAALDELVAMGLVVADEYAPMSIAPGYVVRWARLLAVLHPLSRYKI